MSFDPDAYLAKKTGVAATPQAGGFDPDAYLAKKVGREPSQFPVSNLAPDAGVIKESPAIQDARPTNLKGFNTNPGKNDPAELAGLEALGNAISMGYLPQLQAAAEKFLIPDPDKEVDEQLKAQGFQIEPESSYVQMRDQNIARNEMQTQNYPAQVVTGSILGAGAMTPIGAGAANLAGLGKQSSMMARLGGAVATGAGYGALSNPGDVVGVVNPVQVAERGVNALKSGAIGGTFQGLGEGVARASEAVKSIPGTLDKIGNITAVRAIGAMGKDFKKMFRKNDTSSEIGETLLKNGIVKAGDTIEEMAKKASVAKNQVGKNIGEIYKQTSLELTDPVKLANMSVKNRKLLEITELDGEKLAEIALKKMERSLKNDLARTEIKDKVLGTLVELQGKGKSINILDAQEMKSKLDKRINYDKALKDMPEVQRELKAVRDILDKAIKNRVRVMGRVSGNKGLIDELKESNKLYGQYSKAEAIASNRAKEIEGHRWLSLSENMQGGAGATVGALTGDSPEERVKNALIGFAAGAAFKKSDKFLTPVVANSAKRLGRLLQAPANLSKYGEPIIEAAKESPQEFQAFINSLSNDAGFKKLIKPSGAR